MKIHALSEKFSVGPQVQVGQIQALADAGFDTIICNRPDGESWGQPKGTDIEAAAIAAGMKYVSIPISPRDGVTPQKIAAAKLAQEQSKSKVYAFCKTGTRSANLWALSQAGNLSADQIIASGMQAGYKLHALRAFLDK
ncbi:MAG: TIGR01244 family phosphatase [Robiginitomaculum sp.]|nr:TIGR01244 family phosphatase [Robiginitomaculum sp.]MBL4618320.1 TIGR01244 family phosphatase [Robiginitomaculum sp.]